MLQYPPAKLGYYVISCNEAEFLQTNVATLSFLPGRCAEVTGLPSCSPRYGGQQSAEWACFANSLWSYQRTRWNNCCATRSFTNGGLFLPSCFWLFFCWLFSFFRFFFDFLNFLDFWDLWTFGLLDFWTLGPPSYFPTTPSSTFIRVRGTEWKSGWH
jgi:hypothetical protein